MTNTLDSRKDATEIAQTTCSHHLSDLSSATVRNQRISRRSPCQADVKDVLERVNNGTKNALVIQPTAEKPAKLTAQREPQMEDSWDARGTSTQELLTKPCATQTHRLSHVPVSGAIQNVIMDRKDLVHSVLEIAQATLSLVLVFFASSQVKVAPPCSHNSVANSRKSCSHRASKRVWSNFQDLWEISLTQSVQAGEQIH